MPDIRRVISCLALIVFLGGATLESAEDLKTSQTVTLHLTDGKTVTGILVRAGILHVELRSRPGQPAVKYQVTFVSAIHTREDVFAFNRESLTWNRQVDSRPDASAPTRPTKGGARPAVVSPTQTVEVVGVGSTPEEARKDASRAAVRKVAGELVIGESKVENDRLLADKVLTYSDGEIVPESYKELERKREGDVWQVRIRASVVTRKLADKLVAAGLKVRKVDGEAIVDSVDSRREARKNAAEILHNVMGDLPRVLIGESRKPTPRDYDDEKQRLRLDVEVRADPERYNAWLRRLIAVVEKTNLGKSQSDYVADAPGSPVKPPVKRPTGKRTTPTRPGPVLDAFTVRQDSFLRLTLPVEENREWHLWVMTFLRSDSRASRWVAYKLDCDRSKAMRPVQGTPHLVVTLLDGEGKAIKTEERKLVPPPVEAGRRWLYQAHLEPRTRTKSKPGTRPRPAPRGKPVPPPQPEVPNVAVAPLAMTAGPGLVYLVSQTVRLDVNLSEAELGRMKEIRCEVVFR